MKLTIELTKICLQEKFTPHIQTREVYFGVKKFEIERISKDTIDIVLHGHKDEYLSVTIHCDGHVPVIIAEDE